ncbi:helix-turn-helix domain-containing protein [Roseibium sp.]|uniref:helix-turn-helix domain-containing protein n=1 Tax=Roseibium sp. TaxID=1936156 RepID=UPI003A9803ED
MGSQDIRELRPQLETFARKHIVPPFFPKETTGSAPDSGKGYALQAELVETSSSQASLQPWVEMECIQLSGGRNVAKLDSLDLGSMQIVREGQRTSVQKLGSTPADFCTVSICTQEPATRVSEHCGGQADAVFFLPGNAEFDIHIPAGVETAYVGFSQEEFLRGARALNPVFWERPPTGIIPLTTRRRNDFQEAVDLWLKTAREASMREEPLDPAVLRSHLMQTVLQVAAVSDEDIAPSFNERVRALQIGRRARSFVDDHLNADVLPTIVDICTALGVSERTLRYAFREYVGLSPVAYLRACRLNRVRAVLAVSDPRETTITQVAMRFGFLHLGRFAGDYKRMFGEMPSVTLDA